MQDYNIIKQLTSSIFTRQKVRFENDPVMTTSGIQENRSEAATGGHSVKELFLKVFQNSQEKKLVQESLFGNFSLGDFLRILQNFKNNFFVEHLRKATSGS